MKLLALPLFSASLVGTVLACDSNNCARAITGTRTKSPVLTSRAADCSNYMTTTVYVSPYVVPATSMLTCTHNY